LAAIFSVGNPWAVSLGVIPSLIVLATICVRVPQRVLYGAMFVAILSWIVNIYEASNLNCQAEDGYKLDCSSERAFRASAIIASLLWIAAVGFIYSIPTTTSESATTANPTENGKDPIEHETV
jgi:hypothetical protein